jgi:SAM-dependent methyltransferase
MPDTQAFEKMEREGWSAPEIAAGYANGFDTATTVAARHLADVVKAGPQKAILDLCTGYGVVAAELLARGASVTALDFSLAMIALAQKTAPGARVVQGDAMAMDFADGSFHGVTIGFGVPHFPDPALGLIEAARVLKPGGRIAFSIWCGKGSDGAFGWLFDAVGRLGDPTVTLPPGPDAHLLADSAVAKAMVADAGFSDAQSVEVPTALSVLAPESLFDVFDQGAVRAASLLGNQPSALRDAIRADLAARTRSEGLEVSEGFQIPAPCVIVSAVRK